MKQKKTFIISLSMLIALALCVGTASAATINVPVDYVTIQAAIDAAIEGDTINVADGTYNENIVVDKSLTIFGESKAGTIIIPAFSAPNPGGGGSIPAGSSNVILVEADNVIIRDLTVDGDNPGLTSGIVFNDADIDARNGIITNHVAGTFNNLNINNVLVKNIYLRGIYASTGGSFTISNNTVTNVNGEAASIAIMNWAGTGSFTGNTVSNSNDGIVSNHSTGVTYSGNNVSSCGSGIHTDNNTTSADQIIDNIISDCGYGIFVFAPYVNVLVSGNTITNSDVGLCSVGSYSPTPLSVSFTNNVIDGQNKANSVGIYSTTEIWGYASGNQDASFTNNYIKNTANAFLLASEAGFTNSTTVFENSITGNTLGVKLVNDYTEIPPTGDFSLSMTCNWWGSDDAYDVQTAVSADVNFLPFLSNDTDDQTGIIGFQPVPNSCDGLGPVTVYDDDPLTTGTLESSHMTIQDGIDAAAGGYYINVAAGIYEEQVSIGKELQIYGAGKDITTIQSPANLVEYFTTPGSADNYPIVYIHGPEIVFDGFTIDGLGRGNDNYRFTGIGFWNAGGTISNVDIVSVRNTPFSGTQHGVAVYTANSTGGPYTINLNYVDINDFQKGGIVINGAGFTANVSNCNVFGHGLTSTTAQNGIQFGYGSNGIVENCNVYDISYDDTTYTASGMIFLNGTNVDINGANITSNCQTGILYQESSGSVDGVVITPSTGDNKEAGVSIRDYGDFKSDIDFPNIANVMPYDDIFNGKSNDRATPTNVTLNNLIITGISLPRSHGIGIWAMGDNVSATITNSTIQDWGYGVIAKDSGSHATVIANDNTISNNGYGAWTNSSTPHDFKNNFWGASDGPEDIAGANEAEIGICYSVTNMINITPEYFSTEGLGNEVSNNIDYCPWIPWSCCVTRGNVDRVVTTPGVPIDVADLVYLVDFLFKSGPPPLCSEEGNVDNYETTPGLPIDVADLVYLVNYIFKSGPPPPAC
ncbi:MAG: right-handed parallel beta-helix repeat-containing protein [bacterium]